VKSVFLVPIESSPPSLCLVLSVSYSGDLGVELKKGTGASFRNFAFPFNWIFDP